MQGDSRPRSPMVISRVWPGRAYCAACGLTRRAPANTRSAAHGNPAGPRRLIQRYRASRGPVTDLAVAAFALTD